ncbi:hypothetical protein CAEBREN_05339 [Caenorhabditis brenneri]|uniref:Uncharacterized protein n=1 Tax=Caenorhabditis brenneri TaxID=135651 RepID=G0M7C2_CAEBE|nr:hypothetical protein CAEBREN_05339 [Caenorhabditis brenneri]
MNRFRNISVFIILTSLFLLYCWVLKNKSVKDDSLIFKETNMIPDLTFSKLADLENRMIVELDAITMEDYGKLKSENVLSEPAQNYGMIQVVVFIALSFAGIVLVLCIARRYYLQEDYEFDLERIPSTSILSSQEKLVRGYQTNENSEQK